MTIKKFLLKKTFLKKYREKGFLAKNVRRQLVVNFLFQKIFGLNRDCKYSVNFTSVVQVPSKLILGSNVEKSLIISGNCYYQATNGIKIGDNTIIAPGVKIISANHNVLDIGSHTTSPPIEIGKECWIGANSIILPGVVIGNKTIIGAGSVVSKSFPLGSIVIAGNPAKVLRVLDE